MSLTLTSFFKKEIQANRSNTPFFKLEIADLKGTQDVDVSNFVKSFGRITRKLSFSISQFSPGSHSFSIQDTEDIGKFLFQLREEFGTEFWMDKTYNIFFGYLDGQTEDAVNVYTGQIHTKRENRIDGMIMVSSKDSIKQLHDFKVCTSVKANTVFAYNDATLDERGFQQLIKYGTHKLISNTKNSAQLENRETPFTVTVGFPADGGSITLSKPSGSSETQRKNFRWIYFPTQNAIKIDDTKYDTAGTLKAYYWDYRDGHKLWRSFDGLNFQGTKNLTFFDGPAGVNGFFLEFVSDTITNLIVGDWDEYITGTGLWGDLGESQNVDPAVCVETEDNLIDQNPVRIIDDLLTSSRFIGFDETINTGLIDKSTDNFTAIDITYSFDKTFDFYDQDNGILNINFLSETSLQTIIEQIATVAGFFFFVSSKKSSTQDRRIRLSSNTFVNPCDADASSGLFAGNFSTKDRIKSYIIDSNSDGQITQVITFNFNSVTSTKESFDIKVNGAGTKVLQLGQGAGSGVYWYNSSSSANAVGARRLNQLSEPVQIMRVRLDYIGVPLELADLIILHDEITNQEVVTQVFETALNLENGNTNLVCRRYDLLYGPDVTNPFKLWAFVDCAFVDNDKIAGSGTSASITISTKIVIFSGGDTIDPGLVKQGMEITVNEQHFRVVKVLSTITLQVDVDATATETTENWSIGNSYHVF